MDKLLLRISYNEDLDRYDLAYMNYIIERTASAFDLRVTNLPDEMILVSGILPSSMALLYTKLDDLIDQRDLYGKVVVEFV